MNAVKEPMFAKERQNQILSVLRRDKKVLVHDLCDRLSVSAVTIRADLRELEENGLIVRTHGGAILSTNAGFEEDSSKKEMKNTKQKLAIAREAAKCVQDGETIAIDTGTTALAFVTQLVDKKRLIVITSDLKVALFLEENTDATVILLGGMVRRGYHCSVGPLAEQTLSQLYVDKCFIATNGFTVERGLTTPNIEQASVKRMIIKNSNQVIVICDSEKIGRNSLVSFASVGDIHMMITDEKADRRYLTTISEMNVEIKTVDIE